MVATLVLLASAQLNWSGKPDLVIAGRAKGHSLRVHLTLANFKPGKRKLFWMLTTDEGTWKPAPSKRATAEGAWYPFSGSPKNPRGFYGHDGGFGEDVAGLTTGEWLSKRFTEITSLRVKVDGRAWPVAKDLFDDLLNFDGSRESILLNLNAEGNSLTIRGGGSDGAGSYGVTWEFKKGQKATRSVSRS